jgi:hypothetical protein
MGRGRGNLNNHGQPPAGCSAQAGGCAESSRRFPSGESRDYAGTYANLITSSSTRSLAIRRSGGRGPAK